MSAFHVVVRPRPDRAPSPALAPLYGLFDVIVDGVNITARITDGFALSLLADLSLAVAALASGRAARSVVQLYAEEDVWELGLERVGDDVLVTVFRSGSTPEVAVYERRVTLAALRSGLLSAIRETPAPASAPEVTRAGLATGHDALDTAWPATPKSPATRVAITVAPAPRGGFGFTSHASFRSVAPARTPVSRGTAVERADLHALLVRGDFAVVARGRAATVRDAYPVLVAERLLDLAIEALDASQARRALFRRIQVGDCRLGIRRAPGEGALDVSVGGAPGTSETKSLTFPAIDPLDFASAVVAFARRLGDAFTSNDPEQERNLRLRSLLGTAEAVSDRIEETLDDDSMTNPEPDSYRSYVTKQRGGASTKGRWSHGSKMRFVPKWVATVPSIDLASTFLCGDKIVVGAAREIACLDRNTGTICWRVASARGGSISTPSGVVRIEPDGKIVLFSLETGEVRFATRITPRAAGGATGAVVTMPGLPKLLVVAEGDRKITALDLVTGDVRWRYTGRRPAAYKMRRAGKLLLVTGGDSAIAALDVATGEVVWRVRDRLPFAHSLTLDNDSLFALSGTGADYRLHHVDPWTGQVRYSVPIEEPPVVGQAPLVTEDAVIVPTRDSSGVGAKAFNRADGKERWEHAPGLLSPLSAWLVVDDSVLANSGAGVLLCIDAKTGAIRYNHVFSGASEADQPRRLEPVLRNGALFVPQHEVHVMRPRDGEVIGSVPSDLIPDLLRVDEHCTVYVGEESGHLAAFSAAPKLTLVR